MHRLRMLVFAITGTLAIVAAGLAQAPPDNAPATGASRSLTPYEEAIVRNPFPSAAASRTLTQNIEACERARRWTDSLPPDQQPKRPDSGGMGWSISDTEYWRQIPVAARAIPADWSPFPSVRFTNTQLGGVRDIRFTTHGDYDLWLLTDPMHDLTACISVQRNTRRVWFMEISRYEDSTWSFRKSRDACYGCHASGPRVIRPVDVPGVDQHTLSRFNRTILSYGACDFGTSVNAGTRGAQYTEGSCASCHNGVDRGGLYGIHHGAISFKMDMEATMPAADTGTD